jgi:hypothetical protein
MKAKGRAQKTEGTKRKGRRDESRRQKVEGRKTKSGIPTMRLDAKPETPDPKPETRFPRKG